MVTIVAAAVVGVLTAGLFVPIDIETCPQCGGKLRVIACIEEPQLIARILGHVRQRDAWACIEARGPPGNDGAAFSLV